MPFHIIIVKVKTGYPTVAFLIFALLNNVLLNRCFANFFCVAFIFKEVHPFSNFASIKAGFFICQVINPYWVFNNFHLTSLNTSAFLAKYSMPE